MRKLILVLMAVLMLSAGAAYASPQEYTAVGLYNGGENETQAQAAAAARKDALRQITEQAGIYVQSYSHTQGYELKADEVKTIAASIVKVTHEERPVYAASPKGGFMCRVVLTATADADGLDLKAILSNREELEKLKNGQAQQVNNTQPDETPPNMGNAEANSLLKRAAAQIANEDYHEAVETLESMDDQYYHTFYPQYLHGLCLYGLDNYSRSLDYFFEALKLPHDSSIWRIHYWMALDWWNLQNVKYAWEQIQVAYNCSDKNQSDINECYRRIRNEYENPLPWNERKHVIGKHRNSDGTWSPIYSQTW